MRNISSNAYYVSAYHCQDGSSLDVYKFSVNDKNGFIEYEIMKPLNMIGTKEVAELEICPICCETRSDIITECNHCYCKSCISNWLNTNHSSCPTCRSNIGNAGFRKLIVN